MITVASQCLKESSNHLLLVIPAQAGTQWRYSRVVAKEPDCTYETWRGKGE
jgi:hypothetical protein